MKYTMASRLVTVATVKNSVCIRGRRKSLVVDTDGYTHVVYHLTPLKSRLDDKNRLTVYN